MPKSAIKHARTLDRLPVLGVGVSTTSYHGVSAQVRESIRVRNNGVASARARFICVTSVHGIMTAQADARFRDILNQADFVTPDGMPIVWALQSLGHRSQQRVYGPTLMLELCRAAAADGARVYLYGSREEVLPALETRLRERFPGLLIVGSYSPPFRPLSDAEDRDISESIRATRPDLIFIGISTPKQEHWMWEH